MVRVLIVKLPWRSVLINRGGGGGGLEKAKRNGVSTAAFSAPKQLIGRWLTNSLSAALKLPN